MKTYTTTIGSNDHRVSVDEHNGRMQIDDHDVKAEYAWLDDSGQNLLLLIDGRSYDIRIEENGDDETLLLTYAGNRYQCRITDEHLADLKRRAGMGGSSGPTTIKSPMPGLVVKVLIEPGATVEAGQHLLVLEAMKMENDVKAPRAGTIKSVSVKPGDAVEGGVELLVIE